MCLMGRYNVHESVGTPLCHILINPRSKIKPSVYDWWTLRRISMFEIILLISFKSGGKLPGVRSSQVQQSLLAHDHRAL